MSSMEIVAFGGAAIDVEGARVSALMAEPTPAVIRTTVVRRTSFRMGTSGLLF